MHIVEVMMDFFIFAVDGHGRRLFGSVETSPVRLFCSLWYEAMFKSHSEMLNVNNKNFGQRQNSYYSVLK